MLMKDYENLENFCQAASKALDLCRSRSGSYEFTLDKGREAEKSLEDALIRAHELMVLAIGDKESSLNPRKLFGGVFYLMEAYASLGESNLLEDLFHLIPRVIGGDGGLEEILCDAATLLVETYVKLGKTTKAIQAFKGAYPDSGKLELRVRKAKTGLKVIEYLLKGNESRDAAALVYDFASEREGVRLGLRDDFPGDERDRELRKEYFQCLYKAVGDVFLALEEDLNFKEMERLYDLLANLGYHDLILKLRVELLIPVLHTALKLGRLSDAMRYYAVLTSLAHLDGAMKLIPEATETLMEAYRETGDLEAVDRIVSASL
jgi:hypothetical protein